MNIATIGITGTSAKIIDRLPSITAGMVGATVTFVYNEEWAGFTKTAVFRYQSLERSVTGIGEVVTIPPEMLSESGEKLQVGLYGVSPDGQSATPTIWVSLGRVQPGAAVGNDSGTNPALPVWAQILAMIGQLGELETTAKNSLVAAVNELSRRSSGGLPSFGKEDEGKLLFVRNGTAQSVELGTGLEIAEIDGRPTLRLPVGVGPDSGENPAIDTTLTQSGQAADAKAVGDEIKRVEAKIPTTLPNPKKLTFTGGATGEYDGSSDLTISIPTGGEVSNVREAVEEVIRSMGRLVATDDGTGIITFSVVPWPDDEPDTAPITSVLGQAILGQMLLGG